MASAQNGVGDLGVRERSDERKDREQDNEREDSYGQFEGDKSLIQKRYITRVTIIMAAASSVIGPPII